MRHARPLTFLGASHRQDAPCPFSSRAFFVFEELAFYGKGGRVSMPERKTDVLAKSLENLVVGRKAVETMEKKLARALGRVLARMGYWVVALGGRAAGRGGRRPARKVGAGPEKRRGRPAVAKRRRKPGRQAKARAK
jgi:hypothetical protein